MCPGKQLHLMTVGSEWESQRFCKMSLLKGKKHDWKGEGWRRGIKIRINRMKEREDGEESKEWNRSISFITCISFFHSK